MAKNAISRHNRVPMPSPDADNSTLHPTPAATPSIVNIAAYKFADLMDLPALRADLRNVTAANQLKGTILLSTEGINLFLAGSRGGIDAVVSRIRAVPGLADLPVKESFSAEIPFNRMLVKIKKEIIPFGIDGIDPRRYTSRKLPAAELKRWLDEGRPVTLLDTRNNYEVEIGTFENAVAIDVNDFRDFPKAIDKLPPDARRNPVVTFCTGGIRCEKAAPLLEREGFTDVYQLEGGILKYLEEVGAPHFRGHCFVFDKRVAVDAKLQESNIRQCYACQAVLTLAQQRSAMYVEGRSCPKCFAPSDQMHGATIF